MKKNLNLLKNCVILVGIVMAVIMISIIMREFVLEPIVRYLFETLL